MNIFNLDHQISVIMCSWRTPELLNTILPTFKKNCSLDVKLFVALNEAEKDSEEILKENHIRYVSLPENYGTLSVDFLIPYLKSEYVLWANDDMIFSEGWDKDLLSIMNQFSPCCAQIRGVERRYPTDHIVVGDPDLPHFLDPIAFDVFNNNVKNNKYQCDMIYGLFHPIMVKTKDFLTIGGVSDHFDLNWWPGHSMDTFLAVRLLQLNSNYRFILSNKSFDYHGSSMTNRKLNQSRPDVPYFHHNSEYFYTKTGMTHKDFHRLVKYGEKI